MSHPNQYGPLVIAGAPPKGCTPPQPSRTWPLAPPWSSTMSRAMSHPDQYGPSAGLGAPPTPKVPPKPSSSKAPRQASAERRPELGGSGVKVPAPEFTTESSTAASVMEPQ